MEAKIIEIASNSAKLEICCGEEKNVHCGACGMAAMNNSRPRQITAKNEISAEKGDIVEIELEAGAKTKASLMLFLTPLAVFLAAAGISTKSGLNAPFVFLISFTSLAVIFAVLKLLAGNKTYYYVSKIKEKHV